MKKFVFLLNAMELLSQLYISKRVEGVLYLDKVTGRLTFKAYNRTAPKNRRKDITLRDLDHGWVKESQENYKMYVSVRKALGISRMLDIIRSEYKEIENTLLDAELEGKY